VGTTHGSRRRRDRRGRGLRGPLFPAALPAAASRSEQFDALVVEVLEPIEGRWASQLENLDVAVDEVPDVRREPDDEGLLLDGLVPLSRLVPVGVDRAGMPTRARIVLYRRPLEARAKDPEELAELVRDVLIEQVGAYLGIEPESLE
jgi:predicted Zn-dependent protease with MMP-like domain